MTNNDDKSNGILYIENTACHKIASDNNINTKYPDGKHEEYLH